MSFSDEAENIGTKLPTGACQRHKLRFLARRYCLADGASVSRARPVLTGKTPFGPGSNAGANPVNGSGGSFLKDVFGGKNMKLFRIAGVAVAAAALAACGGAATEENTGATDNLALEGESHDLNAAELNTLDVNAVDANAVDTNAVDTNATDANASDNAANAL